MMTDLLEPIDTAHPCGKSLRFNNDFACPYYQLKSLRTQARAKERVRMQEGELKLLSVIDWQPVADLAAKLLKEQSKDLEICSWFLEAKTRLEGFSGLSDGLNLLSGLIEKFGIELFHQQTDGMEVQLNAVQGLSGETQPGTIIMPLLSLPVINSAGREVATWQYQKACELEKQKDGAARQKQLDQGVMELTFLKSLADTLDKNVGQQLFDQIKAALDALDRCMQVLTENFQERAPQWQQVQETLIIILNAVQDIYRLYEVSETQDQAQPTIKIQEDAPKLKSFHDREAALQMIKNAAEYFLIHEIHSPVGYLLKRALRWADLELPELMQEILIDMNSKIDYSRVTGLEGFENNVMGHYEELAQ
jgi:type VI secretion system protein ImpA